MNSREKKQPSVDEIRAALEKQQYFHTKGFKKLWNYFQEIAETELYITTLNRLILECDIPPQGFDQRILSIADDRRFILPPEWRYYESEKKYVEVSEEIKKLCKRFHLHYMDWFEVIAKHLFYNLIEVPRYPNSYNLCLVSDLVETKQEPLEEFEESDDIAFPVAIRVSPYASQRDIIDFVKKAHTQIEAYQKKYRDEQAKIGRVKTKKPLVRQRDNFIYELRDLPRQQIMRLLNEKLGISLDYGHIGKIISLEAKKRKEV